MREVVVSPRVISLLVCDRCRERRWLAAGEIVDARTALRLAALQDAATSAHVVDLTESTGA